MLNTDETKLVEEQILENSEIYFDDKIAYIRQELKNLERKYGYNFQNNSTDDNEKINTLVTKIYNILTPEKNIGTGGNLNKTMKRKRGAKPTKKRTNKLSKHKHTLLHAQKTFMKNI
jgi:hypothetical protein